MASFLQSLNIFPYKELWRIKNQSTVGHKSVGMASIFVFILLLVVAAIKIVQVFQMTTIYVSTQTDITLIPPMNTLSTIQNSTQFQPFMFAFVVTPTDDNSPIKDIDIIAQYIVIQKAKNGQKKSNNQKITLQKCTTQHFSKVPNIQEIFISEKMNLWTCLPLNQKYEISGSQNIGQIFKYIAININCNSIGCKTSKKQNLILETFALNSFINPYNSTYPSSLYFSSKGAVFQSETNAQYYVNLDKNVINTDRSLLPYKSINKQTSIEVPEATQMFVVNSELPQTQIFLQSSGKTTTYTRSYLKLLDAIAYIGGIFPVIVAAFFFMQGFGKLLYQMKLATYYFEQLQAQTFGFFSFVKQSIYNILSGLNLKPDWRLQQKREKIKEIVNNMLDIVYLQRRIEFLQRGMSIILERHQMKALYLSFKPNIQFSEERFKQFQFRKKFMSYLSKQLQSQKGQSERQNNCTPQLINLNLITQRDIVTESIQNIIPIKQSEKVPQNNHKKSREVQKKRKKIQNVPSNQKYFETQDIRQNFQKEDFSIDEATLDLTKLLRQATALYGNKTSKKIVEHLDSQTKAKLMDFLAKEQKRGLYFVSPLIS